jgi:hypothetical protein
LSQYNQSSRQRQQTVQIYQAGAFSWSGWNGQPGVLGGNMPPNRADGNATSFCDRVERSTVGLVARQNGPVARFTKLSVESFRLGRFHAMEAARKGREERNGKGNQFFLSRLLVTAW